MKKLIFSSFLCLPALLSAGVDPSELQAQIYAMYLSRSPYCTSPIEFFKNDSALHKNIAGGPVIGEVDNGRNTYDGNYPCVIFKLNEHLKFRPSLTTGNCAFDVPYSSHICTSAYTMTTADGTSSSCTDSGEETVFIYLSTASANSDIAAGVNPFSAPTASNANNGLKLTGGFTISGRTTAGFIIDTLGRVRSSGGTCLVDLPRFGFTAP